MQLGVIMGMEINKPWGHNLPRSVKHLGGVTAVKPPNLGDLAVLNPDVRSVARHASSVNDCAILNNGVELRHNSLLYGNSWTHHGAQQLLVNGHLLTTK